MDGAYDSILMPSVYDLIWSIPLLLGTVLVALVAVALVVLVRVALVGRRTLAATAALDEARLELVRERTARLRAGLGDDVADDAGAAGPIA
jgi:uncharacterized protein (DUF58 family)